MPAFAILFIVGGAFLIRQVMVGRATETPGDLKDATTALLSGDTSSFGEVMARRGSNTDGGTESATPVDGSGGSVLPSLSSSGNTALAAECVRLGEAASGYVLGATGPKYFDCSGLVWRAAVNLGLYRGPRFTTATFERVANQFSYQVASPSAGDIVIWVSGGHIGVMVSDTEFYSARSPSKGIGSAPLSADIKWFGEKPDYWSLGQAPAPAPRHGGTQDASV